jgi:shikimate kinase / 3-dehydroquinate synthase
MTVSHPPTHYAQLYLYGPSGSGKSTVGKILSNALNRPFIDLDTEIEIQSGMLIPEIFAKEGESGFRERETQALQRVAGPEERVIALGGGALTVPENRQFVEANGQVVVLSAALETLLTRLEMDTTKRPLLTGDAHSRLKNLLAKRQSHYKSFARQLDTASKAPAEIAWEIQVLTGKFHLRGMASAKYPGYDVRVQAGGLDQIGAMLKSRGLNGPIAVVTDDNVGVAYLSRVTEALANSGFQADGVTIPVGEQHKTLETVSQLWDAFSAAKIERTSTVIGLGGGVVGDLAGFAAATWLRGVPWVAVPTSLLAMVDASMGGKTGADLPIGKNLIGAFHPPRLVLADPEVLATLPQVEYVNGMAEVIKHGVIEGWQVSNYEGRIGLVRKAMATKVKVIEVDPYERGIRAALNLGHTVGHGVELVSRFRIRHGEAVAIGTVAEARLAENIGLATAGLVAEIAAEFKAVGLPTEIPSGLDRVAITAAMQRDKKKAGGVVKFALPADWGDVQMGVAVENWETMISEQ